MSRLKYPLKSAVGLITFLCFIFLAPDVFPNSCSICSLQPWKGLHDFLNWLYSVCDVFQGVLCFVTYPYGVLGQVRHLIV